jgi:hypothetical protein
MLLAGTARTNINPFWGVELTGWGYYIERRWQRVHDDLQATAVAVEGSDGAAIIVALDLMVIDTGFTKTTRDAITAETGVPASAILLTCSHSHNAPAAGGLLGVGECNRDYEDRASRQAATAAILAWNSRAPATLRCGSTLVEDVSFNRTRVNGAVDSNLTAAMLQRPNGTPVSIIVNHGAHPTVCCEMRPWDVSRDIPGRVCDIIEQQFPEALAIYIQGACGDVNFLREFQTARRCDEPAQRLARAAIGIPGSSAALNDDTVAAVNSVVSIPTRRWQREEIDADRNEAACRLADEDFTGWRETIGRCMTNRPDDMVARHGGQEEKAVRAMCRFQLEWTERMLRDLDSRPEVLETEVQAIRIGALNIVANSSELFSPFSLDVRKRAGLPHVMMACYSNGRIGYMPDAHDIAAKSYAGIQSPKYCNQFPFTAESGPTMCDAMLSAIEQCQ